MEEKTKKEILAIIVKMKCPKNFQCYKTGFENLCKANDIGMKTFVECYQETPDECKFSSHLGTFYVCKCPLRIYIAKKLKR